MSKPKPNIHRHRMLARTWPTPDDRNPWAHNDGVQRRKRERRHFRALASSARRAVHTMRRFQHSVANTTALFAMFNDQITREEQK